MRGDDRVAAAEQRGIAGKAMAGRRCRHSGAAPLHAAKAAKVDKFQAGDRHDIGVAGASAAALGVEHQRQPVAVDHAEQPVGFLVV